MGALVGGNFLIAWLLWLHSIRLVSLHTYWLGIVSLRAGFFMGRIEDLGGFIVYNCVLVAGCLGYDVLV